MWWQPDKIPLQCGSFSFAYLLPIGAQAVISYPTPFGRSAGRARGQPVVLPMKVTMYLAVARMLSAAHVDAVEGFPLFVFASHCLKSLFSKGGSGDSHREVVYGKKQEMDHMKSKM